MYCPLKFNHETLDYGGSVRSDTQQACQCEKEKCQLWERLTGTCSLATEAYLMGRTVSIEEDQ